MKKVQTNPSSEVAFYTTTKSPLGELVLTSSGEKITGLYTPEHPCYSKAKKGTFEVNPFKKAIKQLDEYFKGKRTQFDLPLAADGTVFQKSVWKALTRIRPGTTKSYGEIAKNMGRAGASRAVGLANSKNPICILVPCHRVIGANGKLTGYAGGLKAKKWLLDHEARLGK